ncbi:MAG TPA: phage holin family protein [Chitinophagaceae bacterium]|nr:phage holin family protein [Chitinophagaceae bacterium]
MKNFLIKTIIIATAVVLAAYLLPGVDVDRFTTALLVALALSVLNYFVKPLLIILTLPITLVTFGLFLFIINAIIILLAGKLVSGFRVDSIGWALLFSILLAFFTYILETIIEPDYKK